MCPVHFTLLDKFQGLENAHSNVYHCYYLLGVPVLTNVPVTCVHQIYLPAHGSHPGSSTSMPSAAGQRCGPQCQGQPRQQRPYHGCCRRQ